MKSKKRGKPMRVKVTTTIRGDLWEALRIECVKQKLDANDILEKLIETYLKKRGGGR
jgi:hypothetical protein